ncbi:MAG: NAD-dependent epimerase/dehydratase family protein [Solirubrobacterales bacterium]|jgi:UDP-glucose 4-epimerase|nr:NAD-dependent epimerase/dehydratase family protein [Solirubrobacterales bacterium]
MKIVVTGATGNVGTSVVQALATDDGVTEIVGIARRLPSWTHPKTRWMSADVAQANLDPTFAGAAAVIHLAWAIQPSRDERETQRVNVLGSERVFEAAARSGVGALVHASSVGAYSPGPKDRAVDESWPTEGIETSFYSRHKAAVERSLDAVERDNPRMRVVRLRPGLIFKREAGSEIRRLFAGPFLPTPLVRPWLLPVIPDVPGLRVQAVHSLDVADAYRLSALDERARGAYNIAAEPVLDVSSVGQALNARPVGVPSRVLRGLASASFMARLQPTPPGWLDLGLGVPIMDISRAHSDLGWTSTRSSTEALLELIDGMRESAGFDTPPLATDAGGPFRVRELLSGVGRRNP